jgi:hypothetical protein
LLYLANKNRNAAAVFEAVMGEEEFFEEMLWVV